MFIELITNTLRVHIRGTAHKNHFCKHAFLLLFRASLVYHREKSETTYALLNISKWHSGGNIIVRLTGYATASLFEIK